MNGMRNTKPSLLKGSLLLCRQNASSSGANSEEKKVREAVDYCVGVVAQRDYENYLAALLMPKEARPRVFSGSFNHFLVS